MQDKKDKANEIWKVKELFVKLDKMSDKKQGEEGNELDMFWSAKLLEDLDQTMSAIARKQALREIDQDSNGSMALVEYLVWKHKVGIEESLAKPQGVSDELIAAQEALKKVEAALNKVRQALADLARLEEELKQAIAALEAEEAAYKKKCDDLQAKIDNPSTSGMQKAKASNELAQLKSEDPLPLRRAKITQEAALRKVEKQKKQVAKEEDALVGELAEAQKKVDAAGANGGANAPGTMWCMQRQMFDSDYYLPTNKRKFDHSKPFSYDPLA